MFSFEYSNKIIYKSSSCLMIRIGRVYKNHIYNEVQIYHYVSLQVRKQDAQIKIVNFSINI